jgi:uncharacterized protein (DUF433 family)
MSTTLTDEPPAIHCDEVPLRAENGVIFVGKTRVPLDTVVDYFTQGTSAEYIAEGFDSMSLAEVYDSIAYYLRHRVEIDEYVRRRQEESDILRARIMSEPGYPERVESLVARGIAKGLRK